MPNTPKHTPGPWDAPRHVVFGADGRVVALCGQDTKEPQSSANARLIAAAPEMLALLRRLNGTTNWVYVLEIRREAIDLLSRLEA